MAGKSRLEVVAPVALRPLEAMGVKELETLRLVLRGGSVVDWRRLDLQTKTEVDRFLEINLFDLTDPRDERRLRAILSQAVDYLRTVFGYRVADAVARPEDIRDLFLLASGVVEPKKLRRIACVVLKVMHVVQHLEARELLFRTPVREADLAEKVDRRVVTELTRLRKAGLPIVDFGGSAKPRHSLMTKLLAKRESVAAQIFDRLRYRIVTERRDQIPAVVLELTESLFPFNHTIPGQTQNNLVGFSDLINGHPDGARIGEGLQFPHDDEEPDPAKPQNELSGRAYRVLNFVVDLPVRIDEFIPRAVPAAEDLGRIVYSLVEFQVVDAETQRHNEAGDSAHDRYKRRQLKRVLRRLSRGLVVPKKKTPHGGKAE
jgi:uncharacterized protein (TIGR04552 family)